MTIFKKLGVKYDGTLKDFVWFQVLWSLIVTIPAVVIIYFCLN